MSTAAEKARARAEARRAAAATQETTVPTATPVAEPTTPTGDPNAVRRALTPPAAPKARLYPRRITLDLTEAQDDRLAALALELRPVGKAEILRTMLDSISDDEIRQALAPRTWNAR